MTTFDLNSRPDTLVRDTTNATNTRREVVFQPLRSVTSAQPGDALTVTLQAPEWARSVVAMQATDPGTAPGNMALEVGGLDIAGNGAPLPNFPGTSPAGRNIRGVIVSDSVRLNVSLVRVPTALDLRVVFLDH